jgi:phosphoserine phosphatase
MKIALFLDVDITLTTDYIQDVFAKELGVEKAYLAIEREFQETKDSEKFGSALSGLFAAHKFTKAMAHALFDKVNLRSYVGPVFALQKQGVDIYLVSSGPNYYIEVLADNMEVPLDRKICSRYEFEGPNKEISRCSHPINRYDKVGFVKEALAKEQYDFTIGIGDDESQDEFVKLCNLSMLTTGKKRMPDGTVADVSDSNLLLATNFAAVIRLIKELLKIKPRVQSEGAPEHKPEKIDANSEPVPRWFPYAAAIFTASSLATLLYFLNVGLSLDPARKIIFYVWVALSVSASGAFLTGSAVASGKVPVSKDSAIRFTAIGGIGSFIVILLILAKVIG